MLRNYVYSIALIFSLAASGGACSDAPDTVKPTPGGAGGAGAGKGGATAGAAAGGKGGSSGQAGKGDEGHDAGADEADASS